MSETANKCKRCGVPVVPGALQGICPRCLLALNLEAPTEQEGDQAAAGGAQTEKTPLPPGPSIEELARLFPQLEIIKPLGRGGMGAVYKARQPKLDRFVALKILLRRHEETATDAAFAERFGREARALARLNHPDIVSVYDYGEAGGHPYLLMEYVDGITLRQLLAGGKLAPEQALAIVPKICEALQFAHRQGVVHRDIKPENILIDKQGQVKIADFGIAKILAPGAQDHSLTGGRDVIGTPHYMAPEQIEQPTKVDHRADIFSLGVVFYEMLTGELPLGKFQPPSRKVQVDVRLDEIVLHALEKEPARRYQHAGQVKTDVETLASSAGTARPQAGPEGVRPAAAVRSRASLPGFKALGFGFASACLLIGAAISQPFVFVFLGLLGAAGFLVAAVRFGIAWWSARSNAAPGSAPAGSVPEGLPRSLVILSCLLLLQGFYALVETVIKQQPGVAIFPNVVCLVIGVGLLFLWPWARILGLAWVWASYTLNIFFLLLALAQGLDLTGFSGFPTGTALRVELFGRQLGDETTAVLAGVLDLVGVLASFAGYLGTVLWAHWLLTRDHIKRQFDNSRGTAKAGRYRLGFAAALIVIIAATLIWAAAPNTRKPDTILSGVVTDSTTGLPIPRAMVTVSEPGAWWINLSSKNGKEAAGNKYARRWLTVADAKGRYRLALPHDADLLYRSPDGVRHGVELAIYASATEYEPGEIPMREARSEGYYKRACDLRLEPSSHVLQFRRVLEGSETNGPVEWLPDANQPGAAPMALAKEVVIGSQAMEAARLQIEKPQGGSARGDVRYGLDIQLTSEGARGFADFTRTNIGKQVAIVYRKKVISAPKIRSEIAGGKAQISGQFSLSEALDLAQRLNRLKPMTQDSREWAFTDPKHLFDLDRGEPLAAWSPGATGWTESPTVRPLQEFRYDLVGAAPGFRPWVGTLGLGIAELDANAWDHPPSRSDLIEILARADSEYHSGLDPSKIHSDLRVLALDKPLPQTYGFYTPEGSVGILQITGVTNRVEFRYKLLGANAASSLAASPATLPTPTANFSPVVERQLHAGLIDAEDRILDLDEGRVFTVPTNIPMNGLNNPRPLCNWMVKNGADLLLTLDPSSLTFHLDDGRLRRLDDGSTFNTIAASDVERLLTQASAFQYLSISRTNTEVDTPILFKTREGGIGVMQVSGVADNPSTVKLRYKLVAATAGRKSATSGTLLPDPSRAVALFNEIEDFGHEFDAAFASTNLAAAQTGTRRLMRLLTEFNVAVRGTDLEFPQKLIGEVDKVRQALAEGDWAKAKQAAAHNEEYARAFRRIAEGMVEIAREQGGERADQK